jgi:tRNA A-37 threonylcarbamoyl transferase component Bud32
MELLDAAMKWIVAPVAAFVWLLHIRSQDHSTEIAVLKATMQTTKEAHDREFKEMRENFRRVFEKLDDIEKALRN